MKIQEKPDYLIFADSAKNGECTNFPDVSRGWGVTIDQTGAKPPLEWMNGAFNRIDKNMLYLLQQGVPEWSEHVIYPANAIIKYNGVLYTATVKNDNAIPATSNKWKKTQAEIPNSSTVQKGIVKLNSAVNSTSETEASTPLAVKTVNDKTDTAHHRISQVHDYSKEIDGRVTVANNRITDVHQFAIGVNNNVNYVNDRVNVITDKFQTDHYESRIYSHDKRVYIVIRDDGVMGMYSRVKNAFVWYVNHDGWMDGYITADRIGGLDQFVRDRTTPVGVPMPWPQVHPPAGYFECNGSTFDKNKYPKLAAAYPSGKLPDLRGEFIRGWDNARGADPYRVILDWQAPQVSAHRHVSAWGEHSINFTPLQHENYAPFGKTGLSGNWGGASGNDFDNALTYTNDGTNGRITTSRGTTYWNDLNPAGRVGNETRPRNIAFMYIVKAE